MSIAPLGPSAVVRFRVLQRTEPLLRPSPPEGSRSPAGQVADDLARVTVAAPVSPLVESLEDPMLQTKTRVVP